jgi:hypothetical protein
MMLIHDPMPDAVLLTHWMIRKDILLRALSIKEGQTYEEVLQYVNEVHAMVVDHAEVMKGLEPGLAARTVAEWDEQERRELNEYRKRQAQTREREETESAQGMPRTTPVVPFRPVRHDPRVMWRILKRAEAKPAGESLYVSEIPDINADSARLYILEMHRLGYVDAPTMGPEAGLCIRRIRADGHDFLNAFVPAEDASELTRQSAV